MSVVPRCAWVLTYDGNEVTDELAPWVTGIEYTDHTEGDSDELQIRLQNADGRWWQGWFPSTGDVLTLAFGWRGQSLLDAGIFQVDEIEFGVGPDTATIRALAVPMTSALRTVASTSFEETTLRAIVEQLAARLELELIGDVPEVPILRATQANESSLAFLRRLARDYGYAFSVRPPQLVFWPLVQLELADSTLTIHRSAVFPGASVKSSAQATYAACEVRWFDPRLKGLRQVTVFADYARKRVVTGGQDEGNSSNSTTPPEVPSRLLKQTVKGDDVRQWQEFLRGQGIDTGPIDGIFGPLTRNATMAFQRRAGIKVDGIAGPETFRAAVAAGYGSSTETNIAGTDITGRVLRLERKCETPEQAEAMAKAALDAANRLQGTASLEVVGDIRLTAGVNVELRGFGRFDGKFAVTQSRHGITKDGGWTTALELSSVVS